MAREYKKDGIRKEEILEIAQKLFVEKGYEATSIEAILSQAGISKGAFYYYFKSKEELIDALISAMSGQIGAALARIMDDATLDVFQKLRAIHDTSRSIKIRNKDLLKMYMVLVNRQGNDKLRRKMDDQMQHTTLPVYRRIIKQGIREGAFDTPSAEFAAEMIICMAQRLYDMIWKLFVELDDHPENAGRLDTIVDLYEDACERLLGAPKGSLDIVKEADFHAFRKKGADDRANPGAGK
ncbi:MAG: TetR/AcrR family transcriptional regulator [Chitinispirillaceae bacterium]|nr:TetR/AcrR family transcriptional regulator [Chitinispirillaceae bacterium]